MNKFGQILKVWKQKIVRNWSVEEAFRYVWSATGYIFPYSLFFFIGFCAI